MIHEGSKKSCSDFCHQSPIYGPILELELRKKSGYDGIPSCSDFEERVTRFCYLMENCAPVLRHQATILGTQNFIIKAKSFSERRVRNSTEKN